MSNSIRLHPKYGVNPTIPLCFWCQKEKNEVALIGAKLDREAPKNMLLDYEPCDTCAANMGKGIALIECVEHQHHKLPEIQHGLWPTGRWCVVTEDYVRRAFDTMADAVLKHRKAFVEPGVFEKMGVSEEKDNG